MLKTQKDIIGVLIIVAIVLGIAIYYKNSPKTPTNTPADTTKTPTPTPTPVSTTPGNNTTVIKALTADEKKLLTNTPKENATKAEKDAHSDLAVKLAVVTDQLTVNACAASPVVVSIKLGSTLTVTNVGTGNFQFGIDKDKFVIIPAGQSAKVKVDFSHGVGLYGYGCSDPAVQRPIGFIMVTP